MRLWDLDRLMKLENTRRNPAVIQALTGAALSYFGCRLDGFQIVGEPPVYLQRTDGFHFPEAHPGEHLKRPRPPDVNLIDYLLDTPPKQEDKP